MHQISVFGQGLTPNTAGEAFNASQTFYSAGKGDILYPFPFPVITFNTLIQLIQYVPNWG